MIDANNVPPKTKLALWNSRSIINKAAAIGDLIVDNDIDILAICESWLHGDEWDNQTIGELKLALPDFDLIHVARSTRGGGIGVLLKHGFSVLRHDIVNYTSFEHMEISVNSSTTMRLFIIYRPLSSSTGLFFNEFALLLE